MLSIELAVTATLALGMLLVLLPGMIDLSVGSGVGLIGGIASVLVFEHQIPAPLAMGVGFAFAILVWSLMGKLIVRQRIPAFIITLGGLLVFKGAFWLVIHNSTIPVSEGNATNIYALLTTYYLPASGGYLLLVMIGALFVLAQVRARRQRREHGFAVEDFEVGFLKVFVGLQGLLLFAIVMNGFRGIPLSVVILGVVALLVYVVTQRTPFGRYLYAIGDNEEAAAAFGHSDPEGRDWHLRPIGWGRRVDGFYADGLCRSLDDDGGRSDGTRRDRRVRDGDTSLKGGRGTVMGVLFGALIMTSLLNGMTLLAVAPEMKYMVRGVVLILAVWMDVAVAKK